MKVIVLVGVLTALIVAPSAEAAKDPRVPPLQAKVNALSSTVSALQGSITELQRALVTVNDKDTCSTALTFDVLGLVVQYITGAAQSRLDEGGACARLGIAEAPCTNCRPAWRPIREANCVRLAGQASLSLGR